MDLFSKEELRELAQSRETPSVSLFMPTAHVEAELSQNPIRFKNLLREARRELKEEGYRDQTIDEVLQPAQDLLDNESFWFNMSDGLAGFLTPAGARFFRLPLSFEELVTCGSHFHLKPLFPVIAANNRFYVLALSRNHVRLFLGTHYNISEVHSNEIPKSLTDALWYDDVQGGHTVVQAGVKNASESTGRAFQGHGNNTFHGHGQTEADLVRRPNDELYRFFQQVDDGVRQTIDDESAPLVLAGVDYYLPIYREVNKYNGLITETIVSGSTDRLPPKQLKQLHQKAWEVVEPLFMEEQRRSLDRFQELFNKDGGLASDDLREIVPAAVFSRIDTLFVPIGEHVWGHYDADSNTVTLNEERQSGDEDLLDLAAMHTYLNGGTVHALRKQNMPSSNGLAALFRFPASVAASQT